MKPSGYGFVQKKVLNINLFNYKSTYSKGGKAFTIGRQLSNSAGSVIVRNNVFEGITSNEAVNIHGSNILAKGNSFGIYNNSFRMAFGAIKDTSYKFIVSYEYDYDPNDTCQLYIANNIFQGINFSYWIDISHNFPFFSDYNVIYNFRKYKNNLGNIIGKIHT